MLFSDVRTLSLLCLTFVTCPCHHLCVTRKCAFASQAFFKSFLRPLILRVVSMSELRVSPFSRGVLAMRKAGGFFSHRFKVRYNARPTIAKTLAKSFNVTPKMITDIVQQYVQHVLGSLPEVKSASIANLINIKLDTKMAYEALSVGGDTKSRRNT